jgi:L-ascorbate metabolism protein UlaG (beta-lactamase superfamily)
MVTGEMSPYEGLLAAQWLGLKTVLPCHYCNADDDDVRAFRRHHAAALSRGERAPDALVLNPGDWIDVDPSGRVILPKAA